VSDDLPENLTPVGVNWAPLSPSVSSDPPPPPRLLGPRSTLDRDLERLLAVGQVVLVCGIPTQLLVAGAYAVVNRLSLEDLTRPSFQFIAMTSLIDTALVAVMIRVFLLFSGESSRDVFVGPKRPAGEILRGLLLVPVLIGAAELLAVGLNAVFPALHSVKENPYSAYMKSPIEAALFVVVVILAGGIREELQRAFIIRRFDQHLGGARVGLAIFTVFFGALHSFEGYDAAIVIGLLGLLFGVLYIRRGSAVLNMTAHAGFDAGMILLEVLQ